MTDSGTEPSIDVRWPRPGVAQVVLGGEHDLGSAGQLADTVARALEGATHLIVDVSEVTFIDSTTIGGVVAAKRQADAIQCRFNLLLATAPIVERALELTGVLPMLNAVHSLDEALEAA